MLGIRKLICALASTSAVAVVSPAMAQEAASDAQNASQLQEGTEIVVTAQKRRERLIEVPQSVTVLSAEDLSKLDAVQFRDFANTVPGLNYTTRGAGYTQITLRGITVGTDVGPTVGLYVDEVPYGSSSSVTFSSRLSLDVGLFALDRIEVLRGPQGTLYGASTMGGLIKYVTKKPDVGEFGADIQAGVSNTRYGGTSYNAAASVNVPIVADKVALRASAFHSRDGGFIDNVTPRRRDVNRSDISGGRLDLLVTPSDALSIRVTGFLQEISRDGDGVAEYTLEGVPLDGPLEQRRPVLETFDQNFKLISGTLDYDFGPMSLTSVTAFQTGKSFFVSDVTNFLSFYGAAFAGFGTWSNPNEQTTDRFTQELRLAGETGKPLEWMVGGFYSREKTDVHQYYEFTNLAGQPLPNANTFYDYRSPTVVTEHAIFGNLTWHLTDKFDVTGGIRHARNRSTFETIGAGSFGAPRPLTRSKEAVTTYLANARYRFSPSATAYVRFATGYRPGGPNFIVLSPITGLPVGPTSYESDSLNSYEAGLKLETPDRRFGIDLAGYYIDWKNIQIINFMGYRTNASSGATVRGGELALTARPSEKLTATAAFAYTDSKMSEAEPDLGNQKNERMPNVPRFTASLSADYKIATDGLVPTFGATLRHASNRKSAFGATAFDLGSYTSIDLRAGIVLKAVSLQFYVHNLFDERALLNSDQRYSFQGPIAASVTILQPRTFGLTARTSF